MNNSDRLHLQKLISNDEEFNETTDKIRTLRHSVLIGNDVKELQALKTKYARLRLSNPEQFSRMCESKCNFLHNNYTDIYNKVKKDEIDLSILSQFLTILKDIEDGRLDQHEASYKVGTVLKEMYIDSALKKEKNNPHNKRNKKPVYKKAKNISWATFKANNLNDQETESDQ